MAFVLNKSLLVWVGITLTLALIVLFAGFYYDRVYSVDCASMSKEEAVAMIGRILDQKAARASDGVIMFGSNRAHLKALSTEKYIGQTETETEFKIQYIDKISDEKQFVAYIYASCEIQWVKSSDAQ